MKLWSLGQVDLGCRKRSLKIIVVLKYFLLLVKPDPTDGVFRPFMDRRE